MSFGAIVARLMHTAQPAPSPQSSAAVQPEQPALEPWERYPPRGVEPDYAACPPLLVCVLCGLTITAEFIPWNGEWHQNGYQTYDCRCPANGGGEHIGPESPYAEQVIAIRHAWLAGIAGQDRSGSAE